MLKEDKANLDRLRDTNEIVEKNLLEADSKGRRLEVECRELRMTVDKLEKLVEDTHRDSELKLKEAENQAQTRLEDNLRGMEVERKTLLADKGNLMREFESKG